tara:strand:+ start:939 stop:1739 length:801 start_codon:yes stop_codon:yes gene_type:complete
MIKKYLVIGNPIEHSLSPKLHNYWIKKYRLNATYEKLKLKEKDLKNVIKEIKENRITGINVTVPFKKKIIPYLDQLSPTALEANAVNTIYKKNNIIYGDNTDVDGFSKSLLSINFNAKNKKIFIIGAGGVALSIILALKKIGVLEINITNRTISEPTLLKKKYPDLKVIGWGEIPDFDLIINATSLGLNKADQLPIDIKSIKSKKLLYDVIYNPKITNFLLEGKKNGNQIENGIKMFIYQAQLSFCIWHKILPVVNKELTNFLEDE